MEQRAVIKFCADIGKTPTETHKFIKQSVTHSNVSRSLVFNWHKIFSDGRGSLMTLQPSESTSDSNFTDVTLRALSTSQYKFHSNLHDKMKSINSSNGQ
jgi:hypothetical protein